MDPVTQGMLGAAAAQSVSRKRQIATASLVGVIAGMAPDLDVLIRSDADPLLALEYHRQFTHALIFIPLGALLCAVVSYLVFAKRAMTFWQTYGFSFVAYATHALLDACTTYGTLLLWPFSDMRVAWNTVSVVDPLFTLPALVLVVLAVLRKTRAYSQVALLWMACYLILGVVQNYRALAVAQQLAQSRGHTAVNLGVKPSFANIVVWKSVYEHNGYYYVDAIRVLKSKTIIEGSSTQKLNLAEQFPWLDPTSQQAKDVERFRWFSNQHLGLDAHNPLRIIDIRYSLIPNELTGMWGITLAPEADLQQHAYYNSNRPNPSEMSDKVGQLWGMIVGKHSPQ